MGQSGAFSCRWWCAITESKPKPEHKELRRVFIERRAENDKLVVIADSRRATPVERPEQFNEVLIPFL